MSAREHILNRLRQGGRALPHTTSVDATSPSIASPDERLSRFTIETAALGVECFLEDSASAVRARLKELVRATRVMSWDPEYLPYDASRVLDAPIRGTDPRQVQATADVGVTGCDAAIAETGSLVLFSAAGRSRSVSLLPPVHIALVQRHQLCYSMTEMFAAHAEQLATRASCTIITGPSRTADIELTLTLGIHGPGKVIVIVGP